MDWGAAGPKDKICRLVVEKNWDEDEEAYRDLVVDVLPVTNRKSPSDDEAEFDAIPF